LDEVREPDSPQEIAESLASHLATLATWTDAELSTKRGQLRLIGVIAEADEHGVLVPERLRGQARPVT